MAELTADTILNESAELYRKKKEDYQSSKWKESDYFIYGDQSYIHMIHTKYLRMRNIVEGDSETVNFEALEDTLIDMSVYASMFAAYIINKNNEKKDIE